MPDEATVKPTDEPPADDALAPAMRAVDRGDLREARRLATELSRGADAELQGRARAMLDQLAVDPVIVGVFVATGALIVALAVAFIFVH